MQRVPQDNAELVQLAAASKSNEMHRPYDWQLEERQYLRVLQLIEEGQVKTGPDFLKSESIIERHTTPDAILSAHVLALDSLALGDTDARWIAAETLDHYLQSVGDRQIFGTQFSFVNSGEPRSRVEIEQGVLSDSIRGLLCVAPLVGRHAVPNTLKTGVPIDSLIMPDCPAVLGTSDSAKATALYVEDQQDRQNPPADWRQVSLRDSRRRQDAMQLLKDGQLHTGEDFYHVAMLYQHSSTPSEYLLAHTLAMVSLAYGAKDARWLVAATLDRYLRSVWRPQVFGTQYSEQPWQSHFSLAPMDELVSDSERIVLCVVPMTQRSSKAVGSDMPSTNSCL
jgi:hypothetical protein